MRRILSDAHFHALGRQGIRDILAPLAEAYAPVEIVLIAHGVQLILRADTIHIKVEKRRMLRRTVFVNQREGRGVYRHAGRQN